MSTPPLPTYGFGVIAETATAIKGTATAARIEART